MDDELSGVPGTKFFKYYPIYYHLTGSVEAALLLSYFVFRSQTSKKNGWFYISRAQLKMETGVSHRQIVKARKLFQTLAFVEEHSQGIKKPTLFNVRFDIVHFAEMDFEQQNPELYAALSGAGPMPKTFTKISPVAARLAMRRRRKKLAAV